MPGPNPAAPLPVQRLEPALRVLKTTGSDIGKDPPLLTGPLFSSQKYLNSSGNVGRGTAEAPGVSPVPWLPLSSVPLALSPSVVLHLQGIPNGWLGPSENYCAFPTMTFISLSDIDTVRTLICLS